MCVRTDRSCHPGKPIAVFDHTERLKSPDVHRPYADVHRTCTDRPLLQKSHASGGGVGCDGVCTRFHGEVEVQGGVSGVARAGRNPTFHIPTFRIPSRQGVPADAA